MNTTTNKFEEIVSKIANMTLETLFVREVIVDYDCSENRCLFCDLCYESEQSKAKRYFEEMAISLRMAELGYGDRPAPIEEKLTKEHDAGCLYVEACEATGIDPLDFSLTFEQSVNSREVEENSLKRIYNIRREMQANAHDLNLSLAVSRLTRNNGGRGIEWGKPTDKFTSINESYNIEGSIIHEKPFNIEEFMCILEKVVKHEREVYEESQKKHNEERESRRRKF